MPNTIPTTQNTPEHLRLVYAASQAYAKAKEVSGWQTVLAVAVAVLGPAIAAIYPDAAIVAALLAVTAAVVDAVFLEPAAKRYQELGARIQEVFDTDLLQISWNNHRAGAKPTPEEILHLAEAFTKTATPDALQKKRDWYPVDVGPAPLEYCAADLPAGQHALGRLAAEILRVLLHRDDRGAAHRRAALRRDEASDARPVRAGGHRAAAAGGAEALREAKKHDESAAASERARTLLEGFWTKAIEQDVPPAELLEESRRLQDELFDRRKLSPTVPEKLYASLRESHEQEMKYGSQKMVDEVQAKLAGQEQPRHPA